MALTRDYKDTIKKQMEQDPDFAKKLLEEIADAVAAGELDLSGTDWARVFAMEDDEIDVSDDPELDAAFFENAVVFRDKKDR